MNKKITPFYLIYPILLSTINVSAGQTHQYEPFIDTLTGVIHRETFPGTPNYESIKDGDEIESYWILFLDHPIAVQQGSEVDVAESNVSKTQIIPSSPAQYKKYHNLIGKRVRVIGKLMHQISGHHKTKVLILAEKMDAV